MENTSTERILEISRLQKEYFATGATLDVTFRKKMLAKMMTAMEQWESRLSMVLAQMVIMHILRRNSYILIS